MREKHLVKLAYELAKAAHAGQKYGDNDYFDYHVVGVASAFDSIEDQDRHIVALLHDVLEDTSVDSRKIKKLFGAKIATAVIFITKYSDETYFQYIKDLLQNQIATDVKIADIEFHLRQPTVRSEDRYNKALNILKEGKQCLRS